MKTFHIHIKGQVQGLGFRPFIYRLAEKLDLKGWVNNASDGVHIEVNSEKEVVERLLEEIKLKGPEQAVIENVEINIIQDKVFHTFEIILSEDKSNRSVRISPDFAICSSCKTDMMSPLNHRYGYAFTTCTHCGPRYSIINNLPYDRPNTSMSNFEMCDSCRKEYEDVLDRRFYSQTNSCPDCRVRLFFHENNSMQEIPDDKIPGKIAEYIKNGKIGAIKGIGGFLLVCDATNPEVVSKLRHRKNRPEKPFALMAKDRDQISQYAYCSDAEWELLNSPASPILLLPVSKECNDLKLPGVAPNLDKIGFMLPYAPLFHLIMERLDYPVIATSGNLSGSPIIYQNEEAIEKLSRFADFMVLHDREILAPQDDSVISYSKEAKKTILLRRSRGYAPSYFGPTPKMNENQLALGADMKGSFAIYKNKQIYLSQYLGDQGNYDSQMSYKKALEHVSSLIRLEPANVHADQHPHYFSHHFAETFERKTRFIQHHKAHFASILMEKDLIDSKRTILGVIWDGTGYGEDKNIWGGEFFTYFRYHFMREYHLRYVPQLFGDKMSIEPRLSAFSFFQNIPKAEAFLRKKFDKNEWLLYRKYLQGHKLKTSSMGRLFDAVTAILGVIDKSSFEGQAGMYLEALARRSGGNSYHPYEIEITKNVVDTESILGQIVDDLSNSIDSSTIAIRFHDTMVELIDAIAIKTRVKHIAFSGGVFQNQLLVERIFQRLKKKYALFFHEYFSPNDENIAAGQLAFDYIDKKRKAQRIPEEELRMGEIFNQA